MPATPSETNQNLRQRAERAERSLRACENRLELWGVENDTEQKAFLCLLNQGVKRHTVQRITPLPFLHV
jgi:hypothetical protein